MRKIGLVILIMAVVSSMAFAQNRAGVEYDEYHDNMGIHLSRPVAPQDTAAPLTAKVERVIVPQMRNNKTADVHKVEEQLQQFRRQIHDLAAEDSVAVMRGIAALAHTFLDEVSVNPRTEVFVPKAGTRIHALVSRINEPIRAGWKSDNFYIAREIDHFLRYRYHEETENMFDETVLEELWVFSKVLEKYPFYADMDYQLRNRLLDFKDDMANATEENMPIIMQSLVLLADDYLNAYAVEPQNKTGIFVIKPSLLKVAAKVAREIDQEFEVGWAEGVMLKPSDYIGRNIYRWDQTLVDKTPAEELDTFAKVLEAAQK